MSHDDLKDRATELLRHAGICVDGNAPIDLHQHDERLDARVLDIGCGWGEAFKYAAEHVGIEKVGITVSQAQANCASELSAGLPVEIRLQDYRGTTSQFPPPCSAAAATSCGNS